MTDQVRKVFLNDNFQSVLQKNKSGVEIFYGNVDNPNIRYEISFHYMFGRIFLVTQKDLKSINNNRRYTLFSILIAKIHSSMIVDRNHFPTYKKNNIVLRELVDNMIII